MQESIRDVPAQILDRAAELDVEAADQDLGRLRLAAVEAGISAAAFDQAKREIEEGVGVGREVSRRSGLDRAVVPAPPLLGSAFALIAFLAGYAFFDVIESPRDFLVGAAIALVGCGLGVAAGRFRPSSAGDGFDWRRSGSDRGE
jgi:hypothetical protein